MSLRAHIRRIVAWIERCRRHAEIRRALPKLRALNVQIIADTRAHKPTAHLKKAKQDMVHAALARGLC